MDKKERQANLFWSWVAILAFLYFGGQLGDTGDRKVDVNITTPKPVTTPPATR